MDAVILAGGKGTRLRPLTDTRPKPLVPFMGPPFATGVLRRLGAAGCERAVFLVGPDAAPFEPLRAIGDELAIEVELVTEEVALDTAGAARRVLRGAGRTALVCNGDILTDLDFRALVAAHHEAGAVATLALTRVPDTSAFGVVVCDEAGAVQRFVEKPAPGTQTADTVNAGTYVLAPGAFDDFPGEGPLSFERDVFPGLLEAGQSVLGVASPAFWADLGTPRRYLDGHRAVLEGRCVWPLEPAMVLGDGAAVHATAAVGSDARLGPGVVVGAGCTVEAGAHLYEAVLHEGVHVGAGAHLRAVVLGEGAHVGAGAVVGPDVVLGDGAVAAAGARIP